jgi:hypothetical protein
MNFADEENLDDPYQDLKMTKLNKQINQLID